MHDLLKSTEPMKFEFAPQHLHWRFCWNAFTLGLAIQSKVLQIRGIGTNKHGPSPSGNWPSSKSERTGSNPRHSRWQRDVLDFQKANKHLYFR